MPSVETHSIEEAKMDGGFDDLRRSLREMHWMEEVASKRIEVDFCGSEFTVDGKAEFCEVINVFGGNVVLSKGERNLSNPLGVASF